MGAIRKGIVKLAPQFIFGHDVSRQTPLTGCLNCDYKPPGRTFHEHHFKKGVNRILYRPRTPIT